MRIVPVPCFTDNYAYLVFDELSAEGFVIDPSEAEPVVAALKLHHVRLVAILNTHHHHDHVGGNQELLRRFGDLPVFAHRSDVGRVPGLSRPVDEAESFDVAGLRVCPRHVPGHTLGAVAYVVNGAAFTGDTLFVAGCGRLFEGTAAQMHASLNGTLAQLPGETRIFPGHEYTVSNLRFAAHVEPENMRARDKLSWATATRERGEPTVPSTVGDERAVNPFLRCGSPTVRSRFQGATDVDVFAALRRAKDVFR
jgi:hydroxyacylglutathione hydrolase